MIDMFEGASCSSSDRDGIAQPGIWFDFNKPQTIRIDNTDDGDDYATMTLSLKKTAVY